MKWKQEVEVETSEYICLVKKVDGVVTEKKLEKELVYCKDCKWNKESEWVDCFMSGMHGRMPDRNFCSNGKRRTDNE